MRKYNKRFLPFLRLIGVIVTLVLKRQLFYINYIHECQNNTATSTISKLRYWQQFEFARQIISSSLTVVLECQLE